MIGVARPDGEVVKVLPFTKSQRVGFHPRFGFTTAESFRARQKRRVRAGHRAEAENFLFELELGINSLDHDSIQESTAMSVPQSIHCRPIANCQVTSGTQGTLYKVDSPLGIFYIQPVRQGDLVAPKERKKSRDKSLWVALALLIFSIGLHQMIPREIPPEVALVNEELPVLVVPVTRETVRIVVPRENLPPEIKQDKVARRAIQQNLGFLGILGKKNLSKVLGGAPTQLANATAGAGKGGNEGSGGEMLVGLGQGLKRTTVGNTGVSGLGGVGTKGAGGGLGGYGNSSVGSGEGKALSSMAVSQELLLDGGLDASVVRATIAKYLSQVRACYERGLQKNPGLVGQVNMNFEVSGTGSLNYAKVAKSSLGDSEVESCISEKMMTWKFPYPKGGVNVKVSHPFLLRPVRL